MVGVVKSTIRSIQIALLVAGTSGWIILGTSLNDDGKLIQRPNLLHLKGSPFGLVRLGLHLSFFFLFFFEINFAPYSGELQHLRLVALR